MPITDTPLRYPGGKSQLVPFVIELLRENDLLYGEYAEPFAGGAGVAMSLLLNGYVDQIHINDIDPAIYSFWFCVLHHTDELCASIENTKVTMDEWYRQREIHAESDLTNITRLGFSTLFLNRTNRSGILNGGVIGGYAQESAYTIDCRFNKADLVRKIRRIASYRSQIHLSRLDAVDFVCEVIPNTGQRALVNLDPPYYQKGCELYTNFYRRDDHQILAESVFTIRRRWIVTYDNAPEISRLYARYPMYFYGLNYSAQLKRVGTGLMVIDPELRIPSAMQAFLREIEVGDVTETARIQVT